MRALGRHHGHGWEGLEEQRLWKKKKRGGMEGRTASWFGRDTEVSALNNGDSRTTAVIWPLHDWVCVVVVPELCLLFIGLLNILHSVQNIQYFHQWPVAMSGHVHAKQKKYILLDNDYAASPSLLAVNCVLQRPSFLWKFAVLEPKSTWCSCIMLWRSTESSCFSSSISFTCEGLGGHVSNKK